MKRIFSIAVAVVCSVLLLTACGKPVLDKPADTNLEFWLTEEVTDYDFSDYLSMPGFGVTGYYGKVYKLIENEDGQLSFPDKCCVRYDVSSYPDESSKGRFITYITITDPDVTVYGITCASSFEEFDNTFEKLGCKIEKEEHFHTATYNKMTIRFSKGTTGGTIRLGVEVTNKQGIVY